mmetsp:Transcript_31508/g.68707  ORF Transcript_31508/g.68707 Transcript_31508/m.68707 type:complete len:229 (-) Transcript_31508:673-1359(-)
MPTTGNFITLLGNESVNTMGLFTCLFHGNELVDTVDHSLDKSHLGSSDTSLVGDIELSVGAGGRVLSLGSSGLETHGVAQLFKVMHSHLLVELGELKHHGCTETSADIGRTGGDISEMVVVGVSKAISLKRFLDGVDSTSPSGEHFLDISTILHGDASDVVLLVHPHEEGLLHVVEDSSGIRPITTSSTVSKHVARTGLLEKEVVIDELLLFLLGHVSEGVVLACEIS